MAVVVKVDANLNESLFFILFVRLSVRMLTCLPEWIRFLLKIGVDPVVTQIPAKVLP